VQTLVQVPDLPQLQSLVDRLKNVGDLLTVAVTQYGDLHLQVSTSLVTVGSEFRKLRVIGDRGKILH
jgi:HUS1 checkpoint protein